MQQLILVIHSERLQQLQGARAEVESLMASTANAEKRRAEVEAERARTERADGRGREDGTGRRREGCRRGTRVESVNHRSVGRPSSRERCERARGRGGARPRERSMRTRGWRDEGAPRGGER